jgi:hypothetical protein
LRVSLGKILLLKWRDKEGRGMLEECALNERKVFGTLPV